MAVSTNKGRLWPCPPHRTGFHSIKSVTKRKQSIAKDLTELMELFSEINKLDRKQIIELMGKMRKLLDTHKASLSVEELARLYLGLGEAGLRTGAFTEAESDYLQGQKLCAELPDPAFKVRAVNGLCTLKAIQSDYFSAIEGWEELLLEVRDLKTRADINNNLGIAFSMTDRHQQALNCQYQCLKIDEELQQEAAMAVDYFNLASSYMKMKQFDKSLELYNKAIASFEADKNFRYLSFAYSNLSMLFTDARQLDKALDYAQRSLTLKEQFANDLEIGNTYANIGNILKHQQQYNTALQYFSTAQLRFEEGKDRIALAGILVKFAWLYYEMDNLTLAEEYGQKAYTVATEVKSLHSVLESSKMLSLLYAKQKKYKQAHHFQGIHLESHIAIFEDNPKITIARSEADYYRRKAEEQAEEYLLRNIELTQLNKLISEQSELLHAVNNDLECNNKLMRKIYSVIGHDVRGPLLTAAQVLSLMKQGVFPIEEIDALYTDLGMSLTKTANLLSDLLSWSRDEKPLAEKGLEPINVVGVIQDCLNLNQSSSTLKNLKLEYVGKPLILAMAHKNYLHTIIRNLLYNAIKFTPKGGKVQIKASSTKNSVLISISDSGTGLSESEVKRLLSGNYDSKPGTSFEFGTGFGIGLCLDCAMHMQAELRVASQPGKGSKFTVVLQKPSPPVND